MFLKRCAYMLLGLIITTALAGCVRNSQTTPFNEIELIPYLGIGTSTIQGQAFLKTRGGEVRYAAGNTVLLIPITANSSDYAWDAAELDERWNKYIRNSIADAYGNFEFKNIPAGDYYIRCSIFWEYATRYGLTPTGAVVIKRTKVGPNQTVKLMLTD